VHNGTDSAPAALYHTDGSKRSLLGGLIHILLVVAIIVVVIRVIQGRSPLKG
jgi:hypothetical protein